MDESRLAAVPLFASLSRRERRVVARHADVVDLPEGTVLVEEGRFSYEFFVIEEGTADVTRGERRVATLGPSDVLGEMGALGGVRRSATVVATSPVTAIVMTAAALRYVAREMPAVGERLRATIEERTEALAARLGR
jgi:CRP/FNR family cyclic AMP-dependent transcriptional regulator